MSNDPNNIDIEEALRQAEEEARRRLEGLRSRVNGYLSSARTYYNARVEEYNAYQEKIDALEAQKAIVVQACDDVDYMSNGCDAELWSMNDTFTSYIDWQGSVRTTFNGQCCDHLTYLADTYRANIDSVRAAIQEKIDAIKDLQDDVNTLKDWAYRLISDYEGCVWGLSEWAANSAISSFESLLGV